MLITIILFIICILISFLSFTMSYSKNKRVENAVVGSVISFMISFIIISFFVGISYINYIELKQKSVIIHQYAKSINLYSKLAVPNKNITQSLEITDLKYQNYQTSIKELVQRLRKEIVSYNYVLVGKRELGNNIVFNWLIITPDKNMKTLKIEDFIPIR